MNSTTNSETDSNDQAGADPIDKEAAQIDPRSEDAAEKIEDLIEHAEDLGRDATQQVDAEDGATKQEDPDVLPG